MKKAKRQLNRIILSLALMFSLSVTAFAEEAVKVPNDLTVTPIRIFFAILIIPAIIVMEIAFEKIRNKRIEKRNKK